MKQSVKQNLIFLSVTVLMYTVLHALIPELRFLPNLHGISLVPLFVLFSAIIGFFAEGIYCIGKKFKAR